MIVRLAAVALGLLSVAAPLRADPPVDTPLPGERVGGHGADIRASKRLDLRLSSRLDTRVEPRTAQQPLVAANSRLISDADNGCARAGTQPGGATAQTAQACHGPR